MRKSMGTSLETDLCDAVFGGMFENGANMGKPPVDLGVPIRL